MPGPANIEARKQTEHFQVFDPVGMQRNEVTRQMIAKFGQKVVDLLRQYGAYDCISDEEVCASFSFFHVSLPSAGQYHRRRPAGGIYRTV
jgi:hypothetical protein